MMKQQLPNHIFCANCKADLSKGQIICYGVLCVKCWDKVKPDKWSL